MTVATTRSPRAAAAEPAKWGIPTRRANLMFCAKRMLHQLRRGAQDFLAGPQLLSKSGDAAFSVMVGASSTPLWSEAQPEERLYELGKVHNLRRCGGAAGSRRSGGSAVQLLETDRTHRPAAWLCRRTHVAGRMPDPGNRRRPLPTLECALRNRAAGRVRDCRAACALADSPWVGGCRRAGRHGCLELCRSAISSARCDAHRGTGHPR